MITYFVPLCFFSFSQVSLADLQSYGFDIRALAAERAANSRRGSTQQSSGSNGDAEDGDHGMATDDDSVALQDATPAAPPYVPAAGELSIESCLAHFVAEEVLEGDNAFHCTACAKVGERRAKAWKLSWH